MLFSTKFPLSFILLTLLFVTITHAAPAGGDTTDEDGVCRTLPRCLEAIRVEEKILKAKQKELYNRILELLDSLQELQDDKVPTGDDTDRVNKWIRWKEKIEDEIEDDVVMSPLGGNSDSDSDEEYQ